MHMYIPVAGDISLPSIIPTDFHALGISLMPVGCIQTKDIICYKFQHLQMPGGYLVTKKMV